MRQQLLAALLPVLLLHSAGASGFQCLDANGDPLDWFAMLKQPKGGQYAYITSKSADAWIQPSDADLTKNGPVPATLGQIYSSAGSGAADVLAAYNDERPESEGAGTSSRFGHLKGVVALTAGQKGFWLIHSVPKFPDLSQSSYGYPSTGIQYGQSFLCLTVDSSAMADTIGRQLFASHPDLYRIDVSAAALSQWPSWGDLKKHTIPPAQLLNSTARLLTSSGLPVLHVAKSPHLEEDLYSYLLAGQLDSSLQVETWQHGPKLLNSSCGRRYNVTKVLQVRIGSDGLSAFPSTSDHSKWCVSTTGGKQFVCIGDMNRAETQFPRGGGTACIELPGLYKLFKAAVVNDQTCGKVKGVRDGSDRDDGDVRQLLAMFSWVMIAALCVVACTLASALLVLWLAVRKAAANGSGSQRRYQHL